MVGCTGFNTVHRYAWKNFDTGKKYICNVGDPIVTVENGWEVSGITLTNFYPEYKKELLYSGIADGNMQALHREYSGVLSVEGHYFSIKDGYTHPLQYDLKIEKHITFRDMEIEVVEATPGKLIYKVVKWGGEKDFNKINEEANDPKSNKDRKRRSRRGRRGKWK